MIEKASAFVCKHLYLTLATARLDLVLSMVLQTHVYDRPLWPILEITAEIKSKMGLARKLTDFIDRLILAFLYHSASRMRFSEGSTG
jgi:hypothetical protein